jgi:hypothetical protein
MHHEHKLPLDRFAQFIRGEDALQEQDGLAKPRLPQTHGLLEGEHGETIRCRQRRGHRQQAMAIAIGFDHGEDARRGLAAGNGEVVA